MKKILLVIFIAIAGYISYHYYIKERDQQIANNVYKQMIDIDAKLDQLKIMANDLHNRKDINSEVIHGFNELTKENFLEQKNGFISLLQQLDYDKDVESHMINLAESTHDASSFKVNRKLLKDQLKLLKFDYNKQQENFNEQITQITNQVKDLKTQIQKIDSDNLQSLESARLRFISGKLSKTVTELNGSFMDRILDDVIEKDKISDKDADGNE